LEPAAASLQDRHIKADCGHHYSGEVMVTNSLPATARNVVRVLRARCISTEAPHTHLLWPHLFGNHELKADSRRLRYSSEPLQVSLSNLSKHN
jgi:hypothetical protein